MPVSTMGPSTLLLLLLCVSTYLVSAASDFKELYATKHIEIYGGPQAFPNISEIHPKRAGVLTNLSPSQIAAAYSFSLTSTYGANKIIAIINPYGSSTAESDLAKFAAQYTLPACSTANGCFKKVDQTGGSNIPADDSNGGYGLGSSLEIQAAHAIAPGAKKVLICAKSNGFPDLMAGVQYAVNTLHAHVVVMNWGATEFSSAQSSYDAYFSSTTTAFFAPTGDGGSAGGIWYPASSSKVIAVGGTSLYTTSGAFSAEQGWPGSGGGCSAYTTVPAAQSSHSGYSTLGCASKKALPDVSMNADPNSTPLVYYAGLFNGAVQCTAPNCWFVSGGTVVSTTMLAARAAVKGITTYASLYNNGYVFRDITIGSNGAKSCLSGQDLVTGLGSLLG